MTPWYVKTWYLKVVMVHFFMLACSSQSRLAPVVASSDMPTPEDGVRSLVVPYPPPPASVETMPPAPIDRGCLYLDGQWAFGARDWQWVAGGWVIPQPGCGFARSRLFWQTAGANSEELRFRPGRWVKLDQPSVDCSAATACPESTAAITP